MKIIVNKGETLSDISKGSGLSIKEILKLNKQIIDPNKIKAGDEIELGEIENIVLPTMDGVPRLLDPYAPPKLIRKWSPNYKPEPLTWPNNNHSIWK